MKQAMNLQQYQCNACQDTGYIYLDFGYVECGNCSGPNRISTSANPACVQTQRNTSQRNQWTPAQIEWMLKAAVLVGIAALLWIVDRYSGANPLNKGAIEGVSTDGPVAPIDFSAWEPEA